MHGIYQQQNLPYLTVKLCPNCKELIPVGTEICPSCFYNFTSKETISPIKESSVITKIDSDKETNTLNLGSAKSLKQDVESNKVEKRNINDGEQIKVAPSNSISLFCECCGSKIHYGQMYCGNCGTKVSKNLCSNCNNLIDSSLVFCPMCGSRQKSGSEIRVAAPINNSQPTPIIINVAGLTPNSVVQPAPVVNEQPIIEDLSDTSDEVIQENGEKVQEVEPTPDVEQSVTTTPTIDVILTSKECVNRGRKRLFLIIQMLLLIIISAIIVAVPLLTSDDFFKSIIPSFKNEYKESFMSGKDAFTTIYQTFTNLFTNHEFMINPNGNLQFWTSGNNMSPLFSGIPLLAKIATHENVLVLLLGVYLFVGISILFSFIISFIGLFSKRPLRGKNLGYITIMFFILSLLIFINTFNDTFKGYDSWSIYAFSICFLLWFMIKIIFAKECKKYDKLKAKEKEEDIL